MTFTNGQELFNSICDLSALENKALQAFCGDKLGEFFLEYKESEVLKIENGVIQQPDFSFKQGFGLRTFSDDSYKYSYSSDLTTASLQKALDVVKYGHNECAVHIEENSKSLYDTRNFVNNVSLEDKISFLKQIDTYARNKSENIRQVMATLVSSWQVVGILTDEGKEKFDFRPLVRLSVVIVLEKNGILESGMSSGGGRFGYDNIINDDTVISYVDEAVRQAEVKLSAIKAPVGEMPVVLGNGWTGILLHEAIGHGLEGDAIRKKTSTFHNLLGEEIASKNITVVDDGTIANRRGSINIDDEGNDSQYNVLIDNGKLVGFMQDRMNARLMNASVTGNGRREGYESVPLPRMTNTYMLGGDACQEEMIAKIDKGIFAKTFSDGQVDVASGKFVFSASEAYLIENGKISYPVKGAMLIGDGPSILKQISMVGNDFSLDTGVGTCGKDGQWVPVGVGEPSVLIDKITVGGSDL